MSASEGSTPGELRRLLDVFHHEVAALVVEYAAFLQAIVSAAAAAESRRVNVEADDELARRFAPLGRSFNLSVSEIMLVLDFLAEFRARPPFAPVKFNNASADTAHELALKTIGNCRQLWERALLDAERRYGDRGYHCRVGAAYHFYQTAVVRMQCMPSDLLAMVAMEYRGAARELDRSAATATGALQQEIGAGHVTVNANMVSVVRGTTPAIPAPGESSPGAFRFPTPPNAMWKDLFIRFSDGHTVWARVGDVSHTLNFTQMGMNDGRNGSPNKQWDLLRAFAEGRGKLTWKDAAASVKRQKQKELLTANLKATFGIPGDPIECADGAWRTRFCLEPEG